MATSFTLRCPCCEARLTVDPELQAVVAHEPPPPKRTVADLGAALGALGAKAAEREARFRQQMEAESRKSQLLDRKFQEGLKKAKDTDAPPRRPFDFE
jgi:tRNA1(Val) A37 N6-methylase TrmN6